MHHGLMFDGPSVTDRWASFAKRARTVGKSGGMLAIKRRILHRAAGIYHMRDRIVTIKGAFIMNVGRTVRRKCGIVMKEARIVITM